MCTSPFKIRNAFGHWQEVPCGSCDECKLQYRKMWALRLSYEKKYHKKSCFVTLTYDDNYLPCGETLVKEDLQLFMKRLRKRVLPLKFRYFACGEYGGSDKKRPHYHIIFFGLDENCSDFYAHVWNSSHNGYDVKSYSWPFGRVSVDPASDSAMGYVAGYTTKKVKDKSDFYKTKGVLPEFVLMSRKPGIGEKYLRDNYNRLKKQGYILKKGLRYAMPRYYEDKMYIEDDEKEMRHDLKMMSLAEDRAQMRLYCQKYNLNYYQYRDDVLSQREKNIKAKQSLKRKGELNE